MFWLIAHYFLIVFYLSAPVAAIPLDAMLARRRQRLGPSRWLAGAIFCGVVLGTALTVFYTVVAGGKVRIGQAMLTAYFAVGLLLLLRLSDWFLRTVLTALLRIRRTDFPPNYFFRLRVSLGALTRLVVLFGLGLPYVLATVATYRPKVELRDDPRTRLGFAFESASFTATDGTQLSGWWIPAEGADQRWQRNVGQKTVLICHGLASNKSNLLLLARGFVPYGYNVMIFDFRAHGDSGGQLSSFGDLERRDVLGAIHWLRQQHADQARHLYGLGASTGGAALIAAAADSSDDGQAIDAIAVMGTFDSVDAELHAVVEERFGAPLNWLVEKLMLPMANVQVGANLSTFSPAALANDLWPRPIMVIHGISDHLIDFNRGQQLFDSAQQPKRRLWIDRAGHNDILKDNAVMQRVRDFFRTAEPERVI